MRPDLFSGVVSVGIPVGNRNIIGQTSEANGDTLVPSFCGGICPGGAPRGCPPETQLSAVLQPENRRGHRSVEQGRTQDCSRDIAHQGESASRRVLEEPNIVFGRLGRCRGGEVELHILTAPSD